MICGCSPYIQQAIEAERRLRAGERQLYCGSCGRWVWPDECEHASRLTEREFRRLARGRQVIVDSGGDGCGRGRGE